MITKDTELIFINSFDNDYHLFQCPDCNSKFVLQGKLKMTSKTSIDATELKYYCSFTEFMIINN